MASLLDKTNIYTNDSLRLISDADYAAVKLFTGYPDGLLTFASVCCVISMLIGIPGNILTIIALAKYRRVHNATAFFIMNLSFSDLLFCCLTPPLSASTFWNRSWTHGSIMCRLFPPARYILVTVSIFTILAITINRYIIIVYPRLYRKIYQKRNLAIMLVAIWIGPLITLLPTFLGKWGRFDLDPKNGSCTITPDENKKSPKQFLFISAFVFPCVPIIFCYTRIFLIVKRATKKSQNTNKSNPSSTTGDSTTGDSNSITVRVTAINSEISEERERDIPLRVISNLQSEHSATSTVETTDSTSSNTDEDVTEPSEPPRIRRNVLKKSIALLKISLPTRKDKRLGTMILAIMVSFFMCHLPIVLAKVLRWVMSHPAINIAAHILLYFSSSINPVIYVVMSNEYQKAYKSLFKCNNRGTMLIKNDNKRS